MGGMAAGWMYKSPARQTFHQRFDPSGAAFGSAMFWGHGTFRYEGATPIGHRNVRSLRQAGGLSRIHVVTSEKGVPMSLGDETGDPTRRVLLVEDEALVAMVATDSLNELGYDVIEVATARAALDCAHPDCAKFDLAVIDLGLPDRPGDELISDLRKLRPDLPIIVASGYGEGELRRRLKADDRFAFLSKPYQQTSLRAAIDSLGLSEQRRQG